MSFNVKNPEVHGLVRELARLTGQSQTEAVKDAVTARLADIGRPESTVEKRLSAIHAIQHSVQNRVKPEANFREQMDAELYDEWGIPA